MTNSSNFNQIKLCLEENKDNAVFLKRREKTTIIRNGKSIISFDKEKKGKILSKGLSERQVLSFFGLVKKAVNSFIVQNNYKISEEPKMSGETKGFRYSKYQKLKDDEHFWLFDLNSAYWQIMYRMGVIDSNLYDRYKSDKRYKQLKQMAIGLINAPKSAQYMFNGTLLKGLDGKIITITEANQPWRQLYKNVRVNCYNVPIQIAQHIKGDFIFFNQDAIAVPKHQAKEVIDWLECNGYEYKRELCKRIDEFTYLTGYKERKIPKYYACSAS